MTRIAAVSLAMLAGLILVPASGSAQETAGGGEPKVLVVGVDGVGFGNLVAARTPNIDALVAGGSLGRAPLYAPSFAPTVSGPGWATIGAGVWPDRHRIFGNFGSNVGLQRYPDFLTRVERERPSLDTLLAFDWPPIGLNEKVGPIFSSAVDNRKAVDDRMGYEAADAVVTARAVKALASGVPDAAFVYLGNPDRVGHDYGWGSRYSASIEQVDRQVGDMIEAIESRPTFGGEDWLITVTTDHGHLPEGGHGGSSVFERGSWVATAGGGVPVGGFEFQPRIVDIAASALVHLGLEPKPVWELDGRSLAAGPIEDPFEDLAGDLRPAEDEAVPRSTRGWTHRTPAGWAIDNSRMPSGGVSEWRGWSFTNDDFWTQAAPDEEREAFVRSRGVIAVADTDEWADVAHEDGRFDSTLVSAPYDVSGADETTISFGSHYRQSGRQRGTVSVAFDGARPERALTYGPGPRTRNRGGDRLTVIERLEVDVPPGADELTLEFRLSNGTNDWYWAIDAPRVEPSG